MRRMKWPELAIAIVMAAVVVAVRVLPGDWCEPLPVRVGLGVVVALAASFYVFLVDGERRHRVGWKHRVIVGGAASVVIAVLADGSAEVYALSILLGLAFGYGGRYFLGWLKHAS